MSGASMTAPVLSPAEAENRVLRAALREIHAQRSAVLAECDAVERSARAMVSVATIRGLLSPRRPVLGDYEIAGLTRVAAAMHADAGPISEDNPA